MVRNTKCEARKTLKNVALVGKIGIDGAETELRKGSEKLPIRANGHPNGHSKATNTNTKATHENNAINTIVNTSCIFKTRLGTGV